MMGKTTINMTPEQEELLDSGLRMLAHMIAETHLRRITSKNKSAAMTSSDEISKRSNGNNPVNHNDDKSLEDHDE